MIAARKRTSHRALGEILGALSLVLIVALSCCPVSAVAQTGSGSDVHLYTSSTGAERTGVITAAEVATNAPLWGNAGYYDVLGGIATLGTSTFDTCTFAGGAYNKYFGTATGAATTPGTLNFSGATAITSTTGKISSTNVNMNLSGASHITSDSGSVTINGGTINLTGSSYLSTGTGTITLKNCTITMDAASYIATTGAGRIVLDNCTINGNNASRTTAGIRVGANGTMDVANSTIKNFNNTNASALPGGAINTASGATVNFGTNGASDTSAITNCFASASASFGNYGGAAAFVASGTTFNMKGGTVSACGNTTADQYQIGPFAVVGTFTMSGGAITNCKGSHGGAISLAGSGAVATISGGIISNNTAYYDGGAVFVNGGARLTVSGGTITGNSAGRNGAAIGHRSGGVVTITGGAITNNNTTAAVGGATMGAVCGIATDNYGTVNISGSPVISGNTYATSTKADLAVYSASSTVVGSLSTTANVGICSPVTSLLANGAQFATGSATASTITNLGKIFNDTNPVNYQTLSGSAGTGTAVVWDSDPVAKIVDNGVTTVYDTLAEAFAAAKTMNIDATIQMLVQDYNIDAQIASSSTHAITLTTASKDDATYPYRGDIGSKCTLWRHYAGNSLINQSAGSLTLSNITLDGNGSAYNGTTSGSIITMSGSTTALTMETGSVVRNAVTASGVDQAGAILLGSAGCSMYMKSSGTGDAPLIQNCRTGGNSRHGGAIYQANGTTFVATAGAMTGNYCTSTTGGSGACIMQAPSGTNVKTTLGGTFEAYGNYVNGNGSVIHGASTGSVIHLEGSANLHDNTTTADYQGGAIYRYGSTVEVQGSPTVKNNTYGSGTTATARNVYNGAGNGGGTTGIKVTGDIAGGYVGVYDYTFYNTGNQFGTTAIAYNGLENLHNDRAASTTAANAVGIHKPNDPTKVIWGLVPVCKIVDASGVHTFLTLADAFTYANSMTTDPTIEMLVENYEVPSSNALTTARALTIKTASVLATDGYPYRGTAGTKATLKRAASFVSQSLFSTDTGTIVFSDIAVDGNAAGLSSSMTANGGIIRISGAGSTSLLSGATFQNSTAYGYGGAIYADNTTGSVSIATGATVSNCYSTHGGAIFADGANVKVNMSGGTITGCYGTYTAVNGGAVSLMNGTVMNMSGGLITATPAGQGEVGTVDVRNSSKLVMSGDAAITGNLGGGVQLYNSTGESGTLEVSGNARITGNTLDGLPSNVTIRAAQASSATKFIKVTGALGANANIGVSVQPADHVLHTAFASGTGAYTVTSADASYFHDDLTPQLGIAKRAGENLIEFAGATLVVSKAVLGASADLTRSFNFSVTIGTAATGYVINADIALANAATQGTAYSFAANTATTVPLKNGQRLVLMDLAAGTTCSVEEAGMDASYKVAGYDVTATETVNESAAAAVASRKLENAALVVGTTTLAYTNTYPTVIISGLATGVPELILLAVLAAALVRARRRRALHAYYCKNGRR